MVRVEKSGFERHAQTVLGVVIAAGIIWLGSSNVDLSKELAKTTTQVAQLREDMRAMQEQFSRASADRVSVSELRREVQRLDDRISELKNKR